jgi:hypothetical protein
MTLPAWLRAVLPPDTAMTWDALAPLVPRAAYLGGGTAVAVHFRHRVSRDLDFFYHGNSVDLDALTDALHAAGPFAISERSDGTLNGLYSATKVQFLNADQVRPQRLLEQPEPVEGIDVAGVSDLFAMKLKVVGERAEARDYFDLMTIEQQTGRRVEEGLGLFLARFQIDADHATAAVDAIVRGLGYFDDVEEDEALPIRLDQIAAYWQKRQPAIITHLDRFGTIVPEDGA